MAGGGQPCKEEESKAILFCLQDQEISQQNPPKIYKTKGLSLVMCSPPLEYNNAVWGGVDLAARLIGAPIKGNTSLGDVKLAAEEEEEAGNKKRPGG